MTRLVVTMLLLAFSVADLYESAMSREGFGGKWQQA